MAGRDDLHSGVEVNWTHRKLGDLIRRARLESPALGHDRTQRRLAEGAGISIATMGAIERSERAPSLEVLARLAELIEPDEDAREELLSRLLAKWVEHRTAAAGASLLNQPLARAGVRVVQALAGQGRRNLPPTYPRSLEGFPEQFEPLVAVFPDRREVPPESPADLFISSVSVTDFQYLTLLRGMTETLRICSDKLFVVMPEEWLAERFACNLLVVGSSGVNWLTRRLSGRALFRPLIDARWREWDIRYRQTSELDDDHLLIPVWRLLEQAQYEDRRVLDPDGIPKELLSLEQQARLPRAYELAQEFLAGDTESGIAQQFRIPGFADPADLKVQGRQPGQNTDFGVVSLAPHPFDTTGRYVSIICGGISGPATAHGLKALCTQREEFAGHPFGGVLKVSLPPREDWPGRIEKANWVWQTDRYTPAKILANLQAGLDALAGTDRFEQARFEQWTAADLGAARAFVQSLCAPPASEPSLAG